MGHPGSGDSGDGWATRLRAAGNGVAGICECVEAAVSVRVNGCERAPRTRGSLLSRDDIRRRAGAYPNHRDDAPMNGAAKVWCFEMDGPHADITVMRIVGPSHPRSEGHRPLVTSNADFAPKFVGHGDCLVLRFVHDYARPNRSL